MTPRDLESATAIPSTRRAWPRALIFALGALVLVPASSYAQTGGSPWENAVTVLQTSFTGPIARGLSLVSIVGGRTFTVFGRLFGGLLMFVALYLTARWATQHDPQLLRIILRSASARRWYDPAKLSYLTVRRRPHA